MPAPSVTGSVLAFTSTAKNNNFGSQTVPADAQLALLLVAFWESGAPQLATVTLNGSAFTHVVTSPDSSEISGIYRLVNPTTGNLVCNWGNAPDEGAHFFLVFLTNVNTSAPITGSNYGTSTTDPTTSSFSSTTNDLCVGIASGYGATACNMGTSGQTEIADGGNFSSVYGAVGTKPGVATSTTMIADFTGSGMSNSICACSVAGSTGGTTYNQSASGAITPAGTVVNRSGKVVSGALTSAGALINQASKVLAGAVTPDGALSRLTGKILSGEITPAGVVATVKTALVSLAGELTSAGGLALQTSKSLAGAITPDGGLVRSITKVLSGAITPDGTLSRLTSKILSGELTSSGVVATVKAALISLAGELTSAGTLVRSTAKGLAGELTFSGNVVKSIGKSLAGALTSAGELAAELVSGVILQAVGGVLTPAGELIRQTNKSLAGALAPAGTVIKAVAVFVAGVLSSAGTLVASMIGADPRGRATVSDAIVGGATVTETRIGSGTVSDAIVGSATVAEE